MAIWWFQNRNAVHRAATFYFYHMKFPILFVLSCVVMMSCRKDPSVSSGSSSIRYESENDIDIMTNFTPVVNTATVQVENANPWQDILGIVMAGASEMTIDGKPVAVSNLEITNVKASYMELYSGYDFDALEQYVDGGAVVMKYLDGSGNMVSKTIGTLGSFNASSKKVYFTSDGSDLTSFLKNNPDFISFDLELNGVPTGTIEVKYSIGFDYSYSYETTKVK